MPDERFAMISLFAGCGGSSLGYRMAGYRELLAVDFDQNAVDTFRPNFPDVPAWKADVTKLTGSEILDFCGIGKGDLDVLDGSPPCFPASTRILTKHGRIPIGFCTAGTNVISHTGRMKKVIKVSKRKYNNETITITTKYGRMPTMCTPEHPFFTRRRIIKTRDNNTRKNGSRYKAYSEPEWIAANELNVGDVILEPHINESNDLVVPKVVTKQRKNLKGVSGVKKCEYQLLERDTNIDWTTHEMAWVLGFYLAEGHTRGHNPILEQSGPCRREVILSISEHETQMVMDRMSAAGLTAHAQKHGRGAARVTITSVDMWVLCDNSMGKYADGKFVPFAFMCMPIGWQKCFLDGYFDGDGCIVINKRTNNRRRKATTVSWDLAVGITKMIAKVHNIVASIEILYPAGISEIEGRKVNVKEAYGIVYALPGSNRVRPGFVDEYGAWLPIKQIDTIPAFEQNVYNLEVEEDHSYLAEGFAVHNCQGFSTAGKRCVTDDRNDLVNHYIRLVREIRPKVFVMENVSGMVKGKMKGLFIGYVRAMKDAGYRVECRLLNAKWFSVPQSRERMICVGVRNDLGVGPAFPKAHGRMITVREAIGDLRGNTSEDRMISSILKMVAKYQPRVWSTDIKIYKRYKGNSASSFSLKWMDWDMVCGTLPKSEISLTGIVHPDRERYISLAEAKRIGSFPDDFKFIDRGSGIARIGNSVPPFMARAIAETVRDEILIKIPHQP